MYNERKKTNTKNSTKNYKILNIKFQPYIDMEENNSCIILSYFCN